MREIRAAHAAPADIGHGSRVTTSAWSVSRQVPACTAAARNAAISACPAGSWSRSRVLRGAGDDLARREVHDDGTDRHVVVFERGPRLPEREFHPAVGVVIQSGGSGIRTHGELPHTRFPSVPIRPLSHPS